MNRFNFEDPYQDCFWPDDCVGIPLSFGEGLLLVLGVVLLGFILWCVVYTLDHAVTPWWKRTFPPSPPPPLPDWERAMRMDELKLLKEEYEEIEKRRRLVGDLTQEEFDSIQREVSETSRGTGESNRQK